MSRIKYTIVPKDNIEASIFESGVKLSESSIVIDPVIIFNANMELGIETEIYGNDVDPENIKFAHNKSLLKVLMEANDERFSNTIIINGFDIDLDFVRNHIAKMAKRSDKIFSINVISDKRKYTNFTLNLTSEISTEFTDEEWEKYKRDYEESFEKSLEQDIEENKIKPRDSEEDAKKAVTELLKALYGLTDEDIEEDDEGGLTLELRDSPKLLTANDSDDNQMPMILSGSKKLPKKEAYEAYSYANDNGMITIERYGKELIIMDEEHDVVIPLEFKDFIIDVLNKIK